MVLSESFEVKGSEKLRDLCTSPKITIQCGRWVLCEQVSNTMVQNIKDIQSFSENSVIITVAR